MKTNYKSLSKYQFYRIIQPTMKKSIWLLSLLWILTLSWCGSSNVVEYNDNFVELVRECTDANQQLYQNFKTEWSTLDSIEQYLENNISICQNSLTKASQMKDYDGDSSLKDAVTSLLAMEVDYLQKFSSTKPYRNIDNLTEEDKDSYNWIVNDLNESQNTLNSQFERLQDVQEAFAAKHGLKLN